MNKKVLIGIGIAVVIIALLVGIYVIYVYKPVIPVKEQLIERFTEFKIQYDEKKAQGYDVTEAEEFARKAKQAFNNRDYRAANAFLDDAFKALEKAVPTVTPPVALEGSYVKVVDGNPKLFIADKEAEITGFFVTSNPLKSSEDYEDVINYIDKAAANNLTFVIVRLSWFNMDETEQTELPQDAGELINWTTLDNVFDYAASKGVFVVPAFKSKIPPLWWYELTPNVKEIVQTNDSGKALKMASFNAPEHDKYADQVITAMVNRYKDHPALLGWHPLHGCSNQNDYPGGLTFQFGAIGWYDYSEFARQRFRDWLREKYNNDVSALRSAWDDPTVTFESAELPKPLPDISYYDEMVEWINGPGDTRRQWYDWQLFRLEEKKLSREHFANLYKTLDPDHVLFGSASIPQKMGFIKPAYRLSIDYYNYLYPFDVVFYNPLVNIWDDEVKGATPYSFVKYFETHGKATCIDWGRPPGVGDAMSMELIKNCSRFARETGSGFVFYEGGTLLPRFTDEQIKAASDIFHSIPEGKVEKSKFAIIEDPMLTAFYYREGSGKSKELSNYRGTDTVGVGGLLKSTGLDYDILSTNEVADNPDILRGYKAVALVNLARMDESFLDVLLDFRNSGGGLFIVGRTGLFDEYGNKNTANPKKLLNIGDVQEYEGEYSWSFTGEDTLLKGMMGEKIGTEDNLLYIPTFDYEKEGYKVLGCLDDGSGLATVGYKGKTVFWFSEMGTKGVRENLQKFLRNLYEFYGIH